jgi:hypothetical protein
VSHTGLVLSGGYTAPGPLEFFLPDFTGKHWDQSGYDVLLTKASVLLVLGGVLAYLFLAATESRRTSSAPSTTAGTCRCWYRCSSSY